MWTGDNLGKSNTYQCRRSRINLNPSSGADYFSLCTREYSEARPHPFLSRDKHAVFPLMLVLVVILIVSMISGHRALQLGRALRTQVARVGVVGCGSRLYSAGGYRGYQGKRGRGGRRKGAEGVDIAGDFTTVVEAGSKAGAAADRPFSLPPGEFRPKQSLGQNFLSDQNYVMKIVRTHSVHDHVHTMHISRVPPVLHHR
jgi:hypothetical protein